MQARKRAFAAASSFIGSLLGVWTTYRFAEGAGPAVMACTLYALGFLLGCVQGQLFGREHVKAVGYGALAAVLLLWTPIVVVTYGFALLGIPLVIAYAACVAAGAKLITRRNDRNTTA